MTKLKLPDEELQQLIWELDALVSAQKQQARTTDRGPLTDEELKQIIDAEHKRTGWTHPPTIQVARAVERAHGIGVAEQATNVAEEDLSRCPNCNGPADNGWDRGIPPSPYFCTKCITK